MHVFIRVFISVFLYKWYDNSTNLQTNSRKWQYWWQWQWQGLYKVLTDLVNKFTVIGVTFGILNWDFVCIVYGLVDGLSTDYSRNVYRSFQNVDGSFPKCVQIVPNLPKLFPKCLQIILNIPVYCYCLWNSMYNPELNYHYPISH